MSKNMFRSETLQRVGGKSERHFAGRKATSYTDISTQISGSSSLRWDNDYNPRTIDRSVKRQYKEKSALDYGFLRELLGISGKMNTRKKSKHEGFVSEELKEAVMKLRQEVKELKLEIKEENWLKTLDDLGDLNDMDRDFLESLYMLRNAYKRGVFSSTQTVNDIDIGVLLDEQTLSQIKRRDDLASLIVPSRDLAQSPASTRKSISSDCSSDVESTTSSTMIRKRPAKPQIHLSSASFSDLATKGELAWSLKHDEPVLQSEEHVVSMAVGSVQQSVPYQMPERPDSAESSTSYLNLVEENTGYKCLTDENNEVSSSLQKSKQAVSYIENTPIDTKPNDMKIYNGFRSNSPTSKLLQPLFNYPMSEDLFKLLESIRAEISPKLSRLERLENENKLLAVLQVKLAVLQEEKRQLLNTLKQKRSARQSMSSNHSSKTSSPLSSPVSFQSEAEEVFVVRPLPHRAKSSKFVQTEEDEEEHGSNRPPYYSRIAKSPPDEDFRKESQHNGEIYKVLPLGKEEVLDRIIVPSDAPLLRNSSEATQKRTLTSVGNLSGYRNTKDASTETDTTETRDLAVGREIGELYSVSVSTQCIVDVTEASSQYEGVLCENKSVLAGCSYADVTDVGVQFSPAYRDASFGDDLAEKFFSTTGIQHTVSTNDKEVACHAQTADKSTIAGCSLDDRISVGCQSVILRSDFNCGDGFAVIKSVNSFCQAVVNNKSVASNPIEWDRSDFSLQCNLGDKESRTVGVGAYNLENQRVENADEDRFCKVDDKLCECRKPESCEKGIGEFSVSHVEYDSYRSRTVETVACGEDLADSLLYNANETRQLESRGCGEDDVNCVICDQCACKPLTQDTGVGDADVFDIIYNNYGNAADESGYVNVSIVDKDTELSTSTALSGIEMKDRNENIGYVDNIENRSRLTSVSSDAEFCEEVYKVMANSTVYDGIEQKPVICNYCGNKVDLDDKNMDSALNEMRNNLGSYRRNGVGISHTVDNLTEIVDDEGEVKLEELSGESGEEDEDISDSIKNDIVESCKVLQQHLSGEKPMKQQLMLKHLANIEALWFQTVRKKRANAAVVKSYIDLFQSRIPQLLDTIINLMDQDGNTALHYALTYKNTGVVSILLDSQECNVDLFNKAGYSSIMLAALAGFESKTDKYVMQRLLRAGDINAKNRETGQTPLMLAVSRGHAGMVDLLLDSGAAINESDNDGSTALMCACEVGSMALVKALLSNPECDATKEDHDGSTALSIAMDAKRRDLALLIYGSLNFDARGRIKLTPSKQSLLGLGTRRSPSPAVGKL